MKHKLLATAVVGGLAGGAIAFGPTISSTIETNRLPDNVLPPLDTLPPITYHPEISVPTLICPDPERAPCESQNVLASLAIGSKPKPVKSLPDLQPGVAEALVAAEDRRFYQETTDGCDVKAIVRAVKSTLEGGSQGGSTLTRQLAKMLYGTDNMTLAELRSDPVIEQVYQTVRSFDIIKQSVDRIGSVAKKKPAEDYRPMADLVAAEAMECRIARAMTRDYGATLAESKNNILLGYGNVTDFGVRGGRGWGTASYGYFGIPPEQMNRQQGMILAAVLTSPSRSDVAVNYTPQTEAVGRKYMNELAAQLTATGKPITADQLSVRQILDFTLAKHDDANIPPEDKELLGKFINFVDESDRLKRNYFRVVADENSLKNDPTVPDSAKLSDEQAKLFMQMPIKLVPYKPVSSKNNNYDNAIEIGARANMGYILKQAVAKLDSVGYKTSLEQLPGLGLKINTTLDPSRQSKLYNILRDDPLAQGTSTAGVGIDVAKDGAILAMANSVSYEQSPFVLALGAEGGAGNHSSGSGLKGILHAEYLKRGGKNTDTFEIGSTFTIPNGNSQGEDYVVTNDECRSLGRTAPCVMTAQEALAVSSNVWAAQVLMKVGLPEFAESVHKLGITDKPPTNYASVLGVETSAERQAVAMASMLLNDGKAVEGYIIKSIIDPAGRVLWQRTPPQQTEVFSKTVTDHAAVALNQVTLAGGTAEGSMDPKFGPRSVGGKTGTEGIEPGSKANATVNYTGAECGPDGGHATAIQYFSLEGRKAISNKLTSKYASRVNGRYVDAVRPEVDYNCDLAN